MRQRVVQQHHRLQVNGLESMFVLQYLALRSALKQVRSGLCLSKAHVVDQMRKDHVMHSH